MLYSSTVVRANILWSHNKYKIYPKSLSYIVYRLQLEKRKNYWNDVPFCASNYS